MSFNDRRKQTVATVKMKDPALFFEIVDKVLHIDEFDTDDKNKRYWDTQYDRLLQPNNMLIVTMKNLKGQTFLHTDRSSHRSRSTYNLLQMTETYPRLLQVPDDNGHLPLHAALHNCHRQSEPIILKMIELFPMALQVTDQEGNYPLHVAINKKQSEKVVLTMMKLFPDAMKYPFFE